MAVYMIIEVQVLNPTPYAEYMARVPEIVERYGGHYLVRSGDVQPLAGNWHPERIIVLEFETLANLQACFGSPEYLAIAPLREQSTIGKSIVVEGYAPGAGS